MQEVLWDRIIQQAEKARDDVPFETPVGYFGVSMRDMRLGNIIAIAANALEPRG